MVLVVLVLVLVLVTHIVVIACPHSFFRKEVEEVIVARSSGRGHMNDSIDL